MTPDASSDWPGTREEGVALLAALERHCDCATNAQGARTGTCSAHSLLVNRPVVLSRLLFARRIADRLQQEEWHVRRPA